MTGYHNEIIGVCLLTIAVMALISAPAILIYPFIKYRIDWTTMSLRPPIEFGEPIRGAIELNREIWRIPVWLNTPGETLLRAHVVLYSADYIFPKGKIRRDGPMIWLRWEDRENMGKGSSEVTLVHGVTEKVPVLLWDKGKGAVILSEDVLLYGNPKWPIAPQTQISIQLIVKAHGKEFESPEYYIQTPSINGDKTDVILFKIPVSEMPKQVKPSTA